MKRKTSFSRTTKCFNKESKSYGKEALVFWGRFTPTHLTLMLALTSDTRSFYSRINQSERLISPSLWVKNYYLALLCAIRNLILLSIIINAMIGCGTTVISYVSFHLKLSSSKSLFILCTYCIMLMLQHFKVFWVLSTSLIIGLGICCACG